MSDQISSAVLALNDCNVFVLIKDSLSRLPVDVGQEDRITLNIVFSFISQFLVV